MFACNRGDTIESQAGQGFESFSERFPSLILKPKNQSFLSESLFLRKTISLVKSVEIKLYWEKLTQKFVDNQKQKISILSIVCKENIEIR